MVSNHAGARVQVNAAADWPDRLDQYLLDRIRRGDDGKTLLLGLQAGRPRFAVAAGLRGEQDHPHFLIFARYLIRQRFACDGYALMLPALVDDEPLYAVQMVLEDTPSAWLLDAAGHRRAWPGDRQLSEDLERRGAPLPGVQRRDLDGLFARLQLPLPYSVGEWFVSSRPTCTMPKLS